MKNEILYPTMGIFRTIFLYVGQGEATLMIIPDGNEHRYFLIDSNINEKGGGVILKDYLNEIGENKLIFLNTHPHNDHVGGVKDIGQLITEVWHSGHRPGKKHEDSFKELEAVIKKVGEKNTFYLRGSRELNVLHTDREETSKINKKIGDVDFQVFSPAKYICDDIDDEDTEIRKNRIHEQCGVIKVMYKGKSILLTGDSNKAAWKGIVNYYKDALKSDILSAPHHGSRSFFKEGEDDKDIYEDHIKKINPDYLIISSPKQKDSPHQHPHDDAMELYKKYIENKNIFHLGEDGKSVVADIDTAGNLKIYKDNNASTFISNTISTGSCSGLIYETSGRLSKPYCPYAGN